MMFINIHINHNLHYRICLFLLRKIKEKNTNCELTTILIITILVLYYVQKIENKHNKQKKKQFNHQKKVVFK